MLALMRRSSEGLSATVAHAIAPTAPFPIRFWIADPASPRSVAPLPTGCAGGPGGVHKALVTLGPSMSPVRRQERRSGTPRPPERSSESRPPHPLGVFLAPLSATAGLLAISLLPRIRANEALTWSFWTAAVALLAWQGLLAGVNAAKVRKECATLRQRWLARHGVTAQVEFSWGATEVKPPKLADAIVEVTETGSSLRANNLRIVAELLQSTTRFITNEKSYADPWKKQKMDDLVLMLRGAMAAEGRVGLMMNARQDNLPAVLKILPALQTPTISTLADATWVAVNTILDENTVRHIIPQLKAAGACGIVEYPLNKIID